MGWFALSLIVPAFTAYAVVAACDRESRRDAAGFFLRLWLAIGLGIGVSSCTYFLWRCLVGPTGTGYRVCELGLFTTVGLMAWRWARASKSRSAGLQSEQSPSTAEAACHRLILLVFAGAAAFAVLGALGTYWERPLGDWDAWRIWNQRARFLYRADDRWTEAFSSEYAHTDYPLLVPAGNARLWSYLGHEQANVPWFLGTLMTFAAVGVLTAGVCRLRSRSQGLLAGLTLLGMVPFLQRGSWQYADVPLAFYILSAVLLLVLFDATERSQWGILTLCGWMTALAAWTKNEGLLFLVVLPAARAIVLWRRDSSVPNARKELLYWTAGALPVLLIVAIQKMCFAGGNDLVNGQGWEASWARLVDVSRYWRIGETFLLVALRIARPFAVILPLCFLLLGTARNRAGGNRGLATALTVTLLMLAGYFLVYVTTPNDLDWHLTTSADRLLLHLLPMGLLIVFLRLGTPEEALCERQVRKQDPSVTLPDKSAGVLLRRSTKRAFSPR